MDEQQLVSGRELARILGFKAPSYVTKLKKLGVLSECFVPQEGKKHPLIDVEVAVREIEASKDPEKDYVRARWEAYRRGEHSEAGARRPSEGSAEPGGDDAGRAVQGEGADGEGAAAGGAAQQDSTATDDTAKGQGSGPAGGDAAGGPEASDDKIVSFNDAKTRKEFYQAKQAELDYLERAGDLVAVKDVRRGAFHSGRLLRDALMNIPDRLSQSLAANTDPDRIHEILTEEISGALNDFTEQQPLAAGDQ